MTIESYIPTVKGTTKLLAVIGDPVAHSLSPVLHNYWLQQYGIDAVYVALSIKPEEIELALTLLPKLGFIGFNVTVPHKQAAYRLCIPADAAVESLQSVNTIKIEENGDRRGFNTDGLGFYVGLQATHKKLSKATKTVVIGAGGSAPSILHSLKLAGWSNFHLVNRTPKNAERLAQQLKIPATLYDWDNVEQALEGAGLLINTTPLGMKGHAPLILPVHLLDKGAVVYDIIYNPRMTPLLEQSAEYGFTIVNGLSMLVHQAQGAFKHWFGVTPEATPALFSLLEAQLIP